MLTRPVHIPLHSAFSKRKVVGFLFVLPGLTFFLVFFFYPILNAIVISFTKWDLFSPKQFVGLGNFAELFENPDFWQALRVSCFFALGVCLSLWLVSLLLALLVNSELRLLNLFKTIYFIPSILSLTVVAIVWAYMYRRLGMINMVLKAVFSVASIPWLSSSRYALLSIVIVMVWSWAGYYMIIFLAGLQAIPVDLYEVAKIDGANSWQRLVRITLPLLKPTFLFVCIMSVIASLQAFAPFLLMTSGGPGSSTKVITLKIYEDAFFRLHMGRAAAQSMVLFAIMTVFSVVQFRLFRSEASY
jgi:ABC-type sugar transport system permease subunit